MRFRTAAAILAVPALAVGLCSCGTHGTTASVSVAPGASSTASPYVHSDAWANEGSKLADMKKAAHGKQPEAAGLPPDYGTWAYETDPIDITQDGPVTLTATVPASLHDTRHGDGIGEVFPPDADFRIRVLSYDEIQQGSQNQLRVFAVVSDFRSAYFGFRAWLY